MDNSKGDLPEKTGGPRIVCLVLFSVAMAYLESAVVVYLRALHYPEGFGFPLVPIEPGRAVVEIGRELSTLAMLVAVACLAARTFYRRFAVFCITFGIWDIFYYFWLKVLLDWPQSLLTWDVLFLVPLPWIGPVLSPLLVSVSLIIGGWLILRRTGSGGRFAPNWREWAIDLGGALLILLSYTCDLEATLSFAMPRPYRWELLLVGLAAGYYALARSLLRTGKPGEGCG
ncbi:MAG: hypothetical protein JXQ83_00740 [Candidatus Glassbacteria bacterium]|nr:hypothetical protein [Candidatus Glassbacteria bacterium]